jgi:hypothetical protein
MNRHSRLAFGLTILAFWAAPLYSAEKMVPEEGALEVMLLRQQSVQKELKLTDDEIEKVHKHCAKQWEKAQAVSKLSEKEQDTKFNEMSKENERFVETTLTKEQRKRLHEITLQTAGLLCVTRQEVASKLKLTEEQKKRLPQFHKEARQEAEEWIYVVKKEQRLEKLRELRETSRKRLMDLLTDEQEVAWKEMIGAPFVGDLTYTDPETAGK